MKSIERYAPLLKCRTEAEWLAMLIRMGREHGYEKTLIAVAPDRHALLDDTYVRSNYPSQWRNTYDRAGYAIIDPVVAHCLMRSTPLIWEAEMFAGKLQKEMYEEACSHGIRAGVTLPLHGPQGELGILCFVNDVRPDAHFRDEAVRNMPALSMLRDFVFDTAFERARAAFKSGAAPDITGRELECLKWGASGISPLEISQKLNCSERTVNFHFNNIRRKLKAKSRQQAIVKALRMGLVQTA